MGSAIVHPNNSLCAHTEGIGTQDLNRAVADYLLDREAFDLFAREKMGTIADEQKELLKLYRKKWQKDSEAEARAEAANRITDKEAALLKVYRTKWVRDTNGGLDVGGVRVLPDKEHLLVSKALPVFRPHTTSAPLATYHFCTRRMISVLRLKIETFPPSLLRATADKPTCDLASYGGQAHLRPSELRRANRLPVHRSS